MTSRGHAAEATHATAQLRHEHEVFLRALTLLAGIAEDLEAGKLVDRAALAWLVEFFRTFVDRCHHAKEEQHLFPTLERRGVPRDGGPLGVMLLEHEHGRELLRAMSQRDDHVVARAIRGYVTLLRAHIDKENEILLPLADQILAEEEQRALAQAFDAVEHVVVGPGIHERLLSELDRIEAAAGGPPGRAPARA
jgi:hemerythrin-like domain-containing protein